MNVLVITAVCMTGAMVIGCYCFITAVCMIDSLGLWLLVVTALLLLFVRTILWGYGPLNSNRLL